MSPFTALDATTAQVVASTLGAPLVSTGDTLSTIRDELVAALGQRTDLTVGGTDFTRINKYINYAYRDLCSSLQLEELIASLSFNTVAAQPLYKLPNAVRDTRMVSLVDPVTYPVTGGLPLNKRDLAWYRRQILFSDVGPTDYFKYNTLLVLWPTPTAVNALSVEFRIRPDDLVGATDSPILPTEWHEGIFLLAKAKLHAALLEPDLAAIAENDFTKFVRRKTDRAAEETENMIAQARPIRRRSQMNRGSQSPDAWDKDRF